MLFDIGDLLIIFHDHDAIGNPAKPGGCRG
jgi:hypothetical protein